MNRRFLALLAAPLLAVAFAAPALPAAASAAPSQARRSGDVINLQLCTNNSFDGCWRDANNANTDDNPVVIANKAAPNSPAQNIDTFDQFKTFEGHEVYTIVFPAHPNFELGLNNNCTGLELRDEGTNNTAWAETAQFRWINRGCTQGDQGTADIDAGTDQVNGHQIEGIEYPGGVGTTVFTPQ